MGKKDGKKEADKKIKESAEQEKKEAIADDHGSEKHDDAEQDKELIKKMLDEYVGKSEDMDQAEREAMEGLAMEAYQAHKEMGKESKDALHHAGEAVKLARHMGAKQSEAESHDDEKDEKECMDDKKESEKCEDKEESHQESTRVKELEKKLLEADGKIAALEAKNKKALITEHVEKMLRESKVSNYYTKRFLEKNSEFTSTKDADAKWAAFVEGIESVQAGKVLDWAPIAEKSLIRGESGSVRKDGKALDFSAAAPSED